MSKPRIVIDTNVLVAANHGDPAWLTITAQCAQRLHRAMQSEVICLDDGQRILDEYRRHLPTSRRGPGDIFFLWLAQRLFHPASCEQVAITPTQATGDDFEEMPALDPATAAAIDPSDRKFLAVANAHPAKPPILEATDSKWIGWRDALAAQGLHIEFIDEDFLRAIYQHKMEDSA